MDWLSGHMKGRYCSMRLNKYTEERDPWPPIKMKSYITLALVYQKELQTTQETTATIYLRTKGDIDKIPQTINVRKLTDITQIFDPVSGRISNVILIEGHAGIGKTTLVKQVCTEWAEGKLLTSDKLVLLLLLRDPNVQRITDEYKLIEHFTKSTNKVEQLCTYLEDKHGDGVTLIIDGFDELSTELRDYSFFRKLIEKRSLPKAKILVTSRPSASACLHHVVDKRIEILGFEQSSKNQYVTEALQDSPSKLEKLQRHFQQYPNIDAICYIPLIMSIIVFLCMCQPDELPQTATKMYASFILHTISHNLKRVGKFPKDKIINKLEQFPQIIRTALQQLEKTAFHALVEDKIVFTIEELPVVCRDDPTCYGLLQSTECYSAEECGTPTKSFNFLHLGIQEYFAAKYVTTLPKGKVNALLKESFIVEKSFEHDSSSFRLSNMWILYCGITSGQCKRLRHYLATYGNQKISTTEIISQDVLNNQSNVLYLFQCFQEAQDVALCKVLSKSFDNGEINISYHNLLPYQVVSLGYFLSTADHPKLKKLNLSKCHIGDHGMSILHQYLCRDKTDKQEILEINFSSNNLTGASSPLIADIISHLQIHTLLLHDNKLTNMRDISTAVTSSMVKVLKLDHYGLMAQRAMAISDMMICLEELYISMNVEDLTDPKCRQFVSDLAAELLIKGITNTKILRVLHINNIRTLHITNALVNNTSLEELELNVHDKLAMRIIRNQYHDNTVIKVELPNVLQPYDDMIDISTHRVLPHQLESLGFFLSKSHHRKWRKLNLSWCHIGDHGMSILHEYLCGNRANKLEITEIINLSGNNLTGASSPLIADIISHFQVNTLLLHDNKITNVRNISTAVINSSTVKVLDLADNGITAQEAVAITDMMIYLEKLYISDLKTEFLTKGITATKTLRVLHINNIGVSKITTITNALVNNSSLEELNLNINKLTIRIIRTLRLHHNNSITKFELTNISVSFYSHMVDINKNSLQMEFFLACTQSLHSKWNFSKCHIGDHGMSILHECLCRDKASKQEILEINLSENSLTEVSSPLIGGIISQLQVHTLLLCNNKITNVREISTAVITSSTLKVLNLDDNGITAENAKVISDMMICLEELYISSKLYNGWLNSNYSANKLSDHGAELLSKGITTTKTLRVLHIADNSIGPSGITAIANALVTNTSLEELNLNNNEVGKDGAIAIAEAITNNKTLKTLLLNKFYAIDKEESAILILMSLEHNNTITTVGFADLSLLFDYGMIDISAHSLLPCQVVSLGLFLSQSQHTKWKEFNLSICHIGDHGMSILHKYLCENRTNKLEIIGINLSENNLTGASSPLIADIISHLRVHVLWLDNNDITTNLKYISTAVISSSTLKVLSLNDNYITAVKEAVAISNMMIYLEKLYLSNNRFNIKVNTMCTDVDESKGIGDRGAELLSIGIGNTKMLRILHIADNNIGPPGAIAIANALVYNTSLEELNMNYNEIGEDGAKAIDKAKIHNKTLQKLYYSDASTASRCNL